MIKPVPIDGPGFRRAEGDRSLGALAQLQLSRHGDHRGLRRLALDRPLPDRYAADTARGVFGWFFGKKRR